MPLPSSGPPIKTPGPAGFIQWLRREMPKVYQRIKERAPHLLIQGLSGLADTVTDTSGGTTTTFDTSTGVQTMPMVVMPTDVVYGTDPTTAAPAGSSSGGWADTIAKLAAPLITGVEQVSLFNTQLQLAKQGRPPLNASQISLPTIPVGVRLSAGGATPWLIGGGLALGALLLLGGRGRGRR